MSTNSKKGYSAEHAIEVFLNEIGYPCWRPRAGAANDAGDLAGLPVVVSVKNHKSFDLAGWVGALPRMCRAANLQHGVVWHKKRGKGNPADWYVTMDGATFMAFLDSYRTSRLYVGLSEESS